VPVLVTGAVHKMLSVHVVAVGGLAVVVLPTLGGTRAVELLVDEADLAETVDGNRRILGVYRATAGCPTTWRRDRASGTSCKRIDAVDQRREGEVTPSSCCVSRRRC